VLKAFNDHFIEFVNDIQRVFPEDVDILAAKNAFITIRSMNPRLILEVWQSHISHRYKREILDGNIDFFLNKDYSSDLQSNENSDQIMQSIQRLRNPVKNMSSEDQKKVVKYLQNLTKLSSIYFGEI
jgi:hypothetical protein